MTHSFKNTWVTILSIFAMLMANYVSSASITSMNSLLAFVPALSTTHHNSQLKHHIDNIGLNSSSHDTHQQHNYHCDDSSPNVDHCCLSICSNVSYPNDIAYLLSILSPTLALHRSIKIGTKVSRIHKLLRPLSV